MNDVIFVSCAFGNHLYFQQMDRLQRSILKIYPKANLLFYRGTDKNTSTEGMPPGSKSFLDSLYGFKPHAVEVARQKGFKKVIWLDPAMKLRGKVDDLINFPTFVAVKDDSVLHNVVSNNCYKYFGLTREYVQQKDLHLVGGSLYFFNFNRPEDCGIQDTWLQAEKDGIFGSQWDAAGKGLEGHRYDEAVMSICMDKYNVRPVGAYEVRYCITENPMFTKHHFK